ncbi:MAG TPA: VOC family protein, partial [Flavisolibacter sp.]|nr:VOC family protein [Flavisolibacter sp.]
MKLHQLSPILWTNDLEATRHFYETVLGFTGQSHFPNFISLTRDTVEIMFVVPQTEHEGPLQLKLTGSLYFVTEQVNDYWEQVKEKATVLEPLADRQYFMRDFSIRDNNGYELVFGEH